MFDAQLQCLVHWKCWQYVSSHAQFWRKNHHARMYAHHFACIMQRTDQWWNTVRYRATRTLASFVLALEKISYHIFSDWSYFLRFVSFFRIHRSKVKRSAGNYRFDTLMHPSFQKCCLLLCQHTVFFGAKCPRMTEMKSTGDLHYLDSRRVPPSLISSCSKLLVENGWNVSWLVGLNSDKPLCSDPCFQQIPKTSKRKNWFVWILFLKIPLK